MGGTGAITGALDALTDRRGVTVRPGSTVNRIGTEDGAMEAVGRSTHMEHRWPAYAQDDRSKPVPEGEFPISHNATFDLQICAAKACGKVIRAALRVNLLGLASWVFTS
jgi:hypothetical protein